MRTLAVVVLWLGALLSIVAGVLVLAVHGGTCSPHEGGSGCGFRPGLAIPWILCLLLAVTAVAVGRGDR